MDQNEHDMLIRCDENLIDSRARHNVCEIPRRVASLEKDRDRILGALALIIFLTSGNIVIDIISRLIYHGTV